MRPIKSSKMVHRWMRWFKLKYFQLTRTKGGPQKVAKGFSIGIAVEMITFPTGGLAFFLIFPLAWLLRASVAAALLGFILGKVIYVPIAFLNKLIGHILIPRDLDIFLKSVLASWLYHVVESSLDLIVGGIVTGALLGVVLYYPVLSLLKIQQEFRRKRRIKRKLNHLDVRLDKHK